ncbi:hypothetical protein ENBRE01_0176 [Enteropsectra breve]|nr:hypothetical protein ENBRE01_0176 [Enteropsectra breve]
MDFKHMDAPLYSFITIIRNLKGNHHEFYHMEKKKIAQEQYEKRGIYSDIGARLLFLQLKGAEISNLGFVDAICSKCPDAKQIGYLGMLFSGNPDYSVLAAETLSRDMANEKNRAQALSFFCNFRPNISLFHGILSKHEEACQNDPAYIIAKYKQTPKSTISLSDACGSHMYIKLQILCDSSSFENLNIEETEAFLSGLSQIKCKQTLVKALDVLLKIHSSTPIILGEEHVLFLSSLILGSSSHFKQTEIAVALQGCAVLAAAGHFGCSAEAFIYRLLDSANPNSRFIGLNFIRKTKVMQHLALERMCRHELKMGDFDLFLEIISSENYRVIFKRKDEIIFMLLRDNADAEAAQYKIHAFLCAVFAACDAELRCKLLFEHPEIHSSVKEHFRDPQIQRMLLRAVRSSHKPSYFQIIYDYEDFANLEDEKLEAMLLRYLNLALATNTAEPLSLEILERIADLSCMYGNASQNKNLVGSYFETFPMERVSLRQQSTINSILKLFEMTNNTSES